MDTKYEIEKITTLPYDPSYPLEFLNGIFDYKIKCADNVVKDVYTNITSDDNRCISKYENKESKSKYVVDISDEIAEDIQSGKIKLVKENGQFYAQLRTNNKYGKKLPIKEEIQGNGMSEVEFDMSMQLKKMQDILDRLEVQLQDIEENVKDVVTGQQNDRISSYYSGVALFIESTKISDPELKNSTMLEAKKLFTDSIMKLTLTMQSDINYLRNKEYNKHKGKRTIYISDRMDNINQSFAIIHQAFLFKAAIYMMENELLASTCVLDEYSHFIEGIIVKNVPVLIQHEKYETGKENGKWKSRANLKLDTKPMVKQLEYKSKPLYLKVRMEEESCPKPLKVA